MLRFSAETWVAIGILCTCLLWAAMPRQKYSIKRTVRASVDDLWEVSHSQRDKPIWSSYIASIEWDDHSSDKGCLVSGKHRIRFHQQLNNVEKSSRSICIPVDNDNQPIGDLYEVFIKIDEAPIGAVYHITYQFENQKGLGLSALMPRMLRPILILSASAIMNDALKNSGSFERFEALHGPAPVSPTVFGMPVTLTSIALAVLAFLWLVFLGNVWEAVAIMACLLFHELGHVLAMRWFGDRNSRFYFVPVFGGVAIGNSNLSSDFRLMIIVLAGPAAGLLSVLACVAIATTFSDDWFWACAGLFALINALNLLPIPMLDGGQVFNAILRPYASPFIRRWVATGILGLAVAVGLYLKSALIVLMFGLSMVLVVMSSDDESALKRRALTKAEVAITAASTVAVALGLWLLFRYADAEIYVSIKDALAIGPFRD